MHFFNGVLHTLYYLSEYISVTILNLFSKYMNVKLIAHNGFSPLICFYIKGLLLFLFQQYYVLFHKKSKLPTIMLVTYLQMHYNYFLHFLSNIKHYISLTLLNHFHYIRIFQNVVLAL